MVFQVLRLVVVVTLVCAAAALATPPGRIPLALRGIRRILRRDAGLPVQQERDARASGARRGVAFLLVLVAVALAVI